MYPSGEFLIEKRYDDKKFNGTWDMETMKRYFEALEKTSILETVCSNRGGYMDVETEYHFYNNFLSNKFKFAACEEELLQIFESFSEIKLELGVSDENKTAKITFLKEIEDEKKSIKQSLERKILKSSNGKKVRGK